MLNSFKRSASLFTFLLFTSVLGHPAQVTLRSAHRDTGSLDYTGYELRRYGIPNHQALTRTLQTIMDQNIDVWDLTPSHVDVHINTNHTLVNHTYSTLPFSFPYNHAYQILGTSPTTLPDVSSLHNTTFHGSYHTLEEIESFAAALALTYPRLVELVWLGQSWENRDVFAIRIGRKRARKHKLVQAMVATAYRSITRLWRPDVASIRELYVDEAAADVQARKYKDRIVIQGAQHAREWIATSTALYLAHTLVAPKAEPGSLRYLLDQTDFTIIPVPNPDGYVYTWTTDRLWYKNRMDVLPESAECRGIDMNRNWGYEWKSKSFNGPENPCSHWYPGAHPFQAPEVTAIANYIRRTPKIRAFIDLRSYGQKLMYPYSYSCDRVAPHAEDLIEAALGATKALRETHGEAYTSGASCELLYPAPGNIIDWMYGDAKVKYAYSLMLRDTGTYGFMLPPRWIRPVGGESAAAIESLVKFIEDK